MSGLKQSLATNFAGIALKNPLVISSATPGWDGSRLNSGAECGPGAVVTKTIVPTNRITNHPRCGRYRLVPARQRSTPIGMVNADTLSNEPLERWLEEYLPMADTGEARLIISIAALETAQATADLGKRVTQAGHGDAIELNASCPMEGNVVGTDPVQAYQHVCALKEAVQVPVLFKLAAAIPELIAVVDAVTNAGVDGLVMTNSVTGCAGVDIETGRPILPCLGGYSGPGIKPIVQALLVQVAEHTDIPIIAVGGVVSWEDVVEYIYLGASAVGIATGVMWYGYELLPKLLGSLENYLRDHSHGRLEELRGQALRQIVSLEEYAAAARQTAVIDPTSCIGCGQCVHRCFYGAISLVDRQYVIDEARCDGCGLCTEWCDRQAIRLVESRQVTTSDWREVIGTGQCV